MARCSAVWPNEPSAFVTSASVFHSFVFSSSLKSWSRVVGLVPSNRTRTLSFFFTLISAPCHSERSEESQTLCWTQGTQPKSEMFRFAQHDKIEAGYFVRLNLPL